MTTTTTKAAAWRRATEKLAGRRVIASVSGGKDSTAMSLYLTELGIEHDRVHLLTGWDSPITLDYIRGELTGAIGPIVELRGDLLMVDLVRKKKIFPSRVTRFCTQELKVRPMQRYIAQLVDAGEDVVNAVGIRRAESLARSRMSEWEWSNGFDCETWRPLVEWTEQDVIDIHTRHGVRPNPLYLRGAERVGCWPCIFARKSEIRQIADMDPARIDEIRALEAELGAAMMKRAAARGEAVRQLPTFFQGAGRHEGGAPIDSVVAWSRTMRGGVHEDKQEELFAVADEGCMRWGLCETAPLDRRPKVGR